MLSRTSLTIPQLKAVEIARLGAELAMDLSHAEHDRSPLSIRNAGNHCARIRRELDAIEAVIAEEVVRDQLARTHDVLASKTI